MTEEIRHERQDLQDYDTQDPLDSLDASPAGDDPLDRGVVPPGRWSAGMRYGTTAQEQVEGESLDQHLAEEVPDPAAGLGEENEPPAGGPADENAAGEYADGLLLDDGPDPRAGRLVAEDEGSHPAREADLVAQDAGIDGGAATAEEAAVHVVEDADTDARYGG
jgi:Family of unknown function (DUF5709)